MILVSKLVTQLHVPSRMKSSDSSYDVTVVKSCHELLSCAYLHICNDIYLYIYICIYIRIICICMCIYIRLLYSDGLATSQSCT